MARRKPRNPAYSAAADLRNEAYSLPHRPARIALFEERVRLADSLNDEPFAFGCRMDLVEAACFGGRYDLMLVHYPWLLAGADAHPGRYEEWTLLWKYKWIAGHLYVTPDISLDQIEGLLADIQRRFRAHGQGQRAMLGAKANIARHRGLVKEETRLMERMSRTPRDSLTNCSACELSRLVEFHIQRRRDAKALELAAPIISGRETCATIPFATLPMLLKPLWRQKRDAEASDMYRQAVNGIHSLGDRTASFAHCLEFAALSGNPEMGLRYLRRTIDEALECHSPLGRFHYFNASTLVLRAAAKIGYTRKIYGAVSLPIGRSATYSDLAQWMDAERKNLAARFDARNGTGAFAKAVRGMDRQMRSVRKITVEEVK